MRQQSDFNVCSQKSADGSNDERSRSAQSRRFAALIFAATITLTFVSLALAQKKDSCVECHSQLEGPLSAPVQLMKSDIHGSRNLSCVDCHGGDATQDDPMRSMDPKKGYIGKPNAKAIPAFCGKCHSSPELMKGFNPGLRVDQEREYYTSVHGMKLKTGDQKVATCISCHGVHGVKAVKDPLSEVYPVNIADTCAKCHAKADYMSGYKIPTDQYDKYKNSVHAKTLYDRQDHSAPTCNSCHGNHGAAPPGITSVANVCGQCHARQSSLFQSSPHKAVFDSLEIGECIQCHSNHEVLSPSDQLIGVGQKSSCIECHAQGDKGYQTAEKMRTLLDNLAASINSSSEVLSQAERAGMEVSRPKFELNEARDSLIQARVLIHAFSIDEFEKAITSGLAIAQKSGKAGETALAELNYRRKGLGVSLFFILFLAAVIYLKIRNMESKQIES